MQKDDGVPFPETEKECEEYSFRAIYDAEKTLAEEQLKDVEKDVVIVDANEFVLRKKRL